MVRGLLIDKNESDPETFIFKTIVRATVNPMQGCDVRRRRVATVLVIAASFGLCTKYWYNSSMRIRWLVSDQINPKMSHSLDIHLFRSSDEQIEKDFLSLGSRAVPSLINLLSDPDIRFQQQAARNLGLLKDRQAVCALCKVLDKVGQPFDLPQEAAAIALGQVGDPRAIPCLIRNVERKNDRLVTACVEALGMIGETSVMATLIDLVENHPSNKVKVAAAIALGQLGDQSAVPALQRALLLSGQIDVSDAAAFALAKLGKKDGIVQLINLVHQTCDTPPTVRRLDMIRTLGNLRDMKAADILRKIADSDVYVEARSAANNALLLQR